jgi:hypothetical protein
MPVTALVLVFCLQAEPTSCTEQRPIEDFSLQACQIGAQRYAAEWLAVHPKWRLARWRCERNLPRQDPACGR